MSLFLAHALEVYAFSICMERRIEMCNGKRKPMASIVLLLLFRSTEFITRLVHVSLVSVHVSCKGS
jgi:hypothetical protein